jgi:hypothetical protein
VRDCQQIDGYIDAHLVGAQPEYGSAGLTFSALSSIDGTHVFGALGLDPGVISVRPGADGAAARGMRHYSLTAKAPYAALFFARSDGQPADIVASAWLYCS